MPLQRIENALGHFLHFTRTPDGYDDKGNLLVEIDALGQMTEYLNSDDGLPHTIIDATYKSKYLWWNTLAQVERYQDCSGKSTYYRYEDPCFGFLRT